jgi:hypothetical protein
MDFVRDAPFNLPDGAGKEHSEYTGRQGCSLVRAYGKRKMNLPFPGFQPSAVPSIGRT